MTWPLEHRRDSLRSAIALAIREGGNPHRVKGEHLIATYGAQIKLSAFNKWWAEEQAKHDREVAEKLTRIPPNTDLGGEGK